MLLVVCDWKACTTNRLYSDTGFVRYFYIAGGVVSMCVVSLCVVSLCVVSLCVTGRLVPVTGSIVTWVL